MLFFYFWGVLYLYDMTYGIHTSTDHYLPAVSGWFHWHLILQLAAPFQIHFGPQNRHETGKLQEIHWASTSKYKGPPGFYNVLPSKFWGFQWFFHQQPGQSHWIVGWATKNHREWKPTVQLSNKIHACTLATLFGGAFGSELIWEKSPEEVSQGPNLTEPLPSLPAVFVVESLADSRAQGVPRNPRNRVARQMMGEYPWKRSCSLKPGELLDSYGGNQWKKMSGASSHPHSAPISSPRSWSVVYLTSNVENTPPLSTQIGLLLYWSIQWI